MNPSPAHIDQDGYLGLGTITQTLEAIRSVSLFFTLLREKSCLSQFDGQSIQTVLAPTNDAIQKLGIKKQRLLTQSSEAFASLLKQLSIPQFLLIGPPSSEKHQSLSAVHKHICIQNIPATNGVIHIIDNLNAFQIGN